MLKTVVVSTFCLSLIFACSEEKSTEKKEDKKEQQVTDESVKESPAVINPEAKEFETVEFKAADGLTVTGNYYEVDALAPLIVLCHQARYNKFEYAGIAPRLNKMGFNCLAIDQRSGGPISTYKNETMNRAVASDKPIGYLDAEQDIIAAIDWAYIKSNKPVILWGSSYSSTLSLYIAMANEKVSAVISFSPGNYFSEKKGNLKEMLPNYSKPMFITSTKYENLHVKQFMANVILKDKQVVFVPTTEGYHGSQALWEGQPEGAQYWTAIVEFLNGVR